MDMIHRNLFAADASSKALVDTSGSLTITTGFLAWRLHSLQPRDQTVEHIGH